MCGDFNVHVDQIGDANAVRLDQLLQSFGYVQHVSGPTHNDGHTLDLVIARSDVIVNDLYVGAMISDHAFIRFKLKVKKSVEDSVWTVTSRARRQLSRDAFEADPAASILTSSRTCLSMIWPSCIGML